MAYVTRLMRQRARDEQAETPERVAERLRARAVAEQAVREREERFPVLTAENAKDAIEWQEARIKHLLNA